MRAATTRSCWPTAAARARTSAAAGWLICCWGKSSLSLAGLPPRTRCPMLAKLNTFALVGIDAVPVVAEVDAAPGLPKTVLVGLPEAAVRESVHRVERAFVNLGYQRHPG